MSSIFLSRSMIGCPDSWLERRSLHISWITFLTVLLIFTNLEAQNRRIAIFGSSVANGSGDTTEAGGYAGLLARLLAVNNWEVTNVSRGGDNTTKILSRFETDLLPLHPKYVIIGLSLGNEGIANGSELKRSRVFEKYRSGLFHLVQLCSQNNMIPIVAGCYARNDFLNEQYEAVKKMNLLINTWDMPSVNLLGCIDNGKGNWLEGCFHDKAHPNYIGHREMYFSFVPSLFDAIDAGKKVPFKIRNAGYLSISSSGSPDPLRFIPSDTIHSFSVFFLVRTKGNGCLAAINPGIVGSRIESNGNKIIYRSTTGSILASDTSSENSGWQYVGLTHQYISGKTTFYVNGMDAGSVQEAIDFKEFILGGYGEQSVVKAPDNAGYKDLLIYRSVLNHDEAKAVYYDQLIQSSLEIYAPLSEDHFISGEAVQNLAQSMSKLICKGNGLIPIK